MVLKFNRRSFLAALATCIARPAVAVPRGSSFDAIVVGAGAAGIAAGRRLAAAGFRVAVLEATDRVGGRCFTDMHMFSVPYDRGAHWLYAQEINPVAKLALNTGLNIYPAPPNQRLRIGRRNGRDAEMEDFFVARQRCARAIQEAARGGSDISAAEALPRDLGEWRPVMEFVLGSFRCGKGLEEVSAIDFARSEQRENNIFCREGIGSLITKLAVGLPMHLSRQVDRGSEPERGFARPRGDRHRLNGCAECRKDPIRPRFAESSC